MTSILPAEQRLAAPVYATTRALARYIPTTENRYAIVPGVGLYTWHLSSLADGDGTNIVEPYNGSAGRWILSNPFNATPSAYTLTSAPLTMTGNRVATYSGTSPCQLSRATSGHVSGAQFMLVIPPATAASLYVSPDLNITGDITLDPDTNEVTNFDTAKPYLLALEQLNTDYTVGSLRELNVLDTVAPTVVSATANAANPDAISVQFSKPVKARNITGLSVSFSSGTARTITAIESGDGTATITFTLSGTLVGTEVLNFVVAGDATAAGYNGVQVTASTTLVTMVFVPGSLLSAAAWSRVFEKSTALLPTTGLPANFQSWTDQVGGAVQITPAEAGRPARQTDGTVRWTNNVNQRVECAATLSTGTDFAFFCRFKANDAGTWAPMSFSRYTTGAGFVAIIQSSSAISVKLNDGTSEDEALDALTVGTTDWHLVFVQRSGTTLSIRVNDRSAVTVTSNLVANTSTVCNLGNLEIPFVEYEPGNGDISDAGWKSNAVFTELEITNIKARISSR